MASVRLNPKTLRWARELRNLSLEGAADKLGVDSKELETWEVTSSEVGIGKFEKIASAYRLPASVLFSKFPPTVEKVPVDFRTFDGSKPKHSFEFSVALSRAHDKARRLVLLENEVKSEVFPELPQYSLGDNPGDLASKERERLNLSPLASLGFPAGKSFHKFRAIIEKTGIPVFQEKFPEEDCRGFTFNYPDLGPVIVINRDERFEKAKSFTLVHEYCHVLLRQFGLSDLDNRNRVERFCNQFAAAFLMPPELVRELFGEVPNSPRDIPTKDIRYRSGRMKVSQQALAIRLEELSYVPNGFAQKFRRYDGFTPKKPSEGGNPSATLFSDHGGRFLSAVFEGLTQGEIREGSLSEYFGNRAGSLTELSEAVDRFERYAQTE